PGAGGEGEPEDGGAQGEVAVCAAPGCSGDLSAQCRAGEHGEARAQGGARVGDAGAAQRGLAHAQRGGGGRGDQGSLGGAHGLVEWFGAGIRGGAAGMPRSCSWTALMGRAHGLRTRRGKRGAARVPPWAGAATFGRTRSAVQATWAARFALGTAAAEA